MAGNFHISCSRKDSILNVNLKGDFDGTSAYELLNVLERNVNNTSTIFIQTNDLLNVYPFGKDLFQKKLAVLMDIRPRLVFKGENAEQIIPESNIFF